MFGWLTGKPKSSLPEPTALQTQRVKQIEQLKTCNQNVSEVHRDVEYRVNFKANNGTALSLQITLPPQFPQEKPVIFIAPKGVHHWVNEQGAVTGCASLNSFVVHSDLGKVVKEMVEEFQRNPPALAPQHHYGVGYPNPYPVNPQAPGHPTLPAYSPYPPQPPPGGATGYMGAGIPMPTLPAASSATGAVPGMNTAHGVASPGMPKPSPASSQMPKGAVGSYRMPDIPSSFPHLRDLSNAELKELADDEGKLLEFLGNLPEIKKISQDRQSLTEQNEERARQNISKRPCLEEQKRLLLDKFARQKRSKMTEDTFTLYVNEFDSSTPRNCAMTAFDIPNYDHLNEMRRQFDENCKRQDELRQQYNIENLHDNLKVAAMQAEEEAEAIAERFLEGETSVDEFKKKFMEIRMKSLLRRAKEEKLLGHAV